MYERGGPVPSPGRDRFEVHIRGRGLPQAARQKAPHGAPTPRRRSLPGAGRLRRNALARPRRLRAPDHRPEPAGARRYYRLIYQHGRFRNAHFRLLGLPHGQSVERGHGALHAACIQKRRGTRLLRAEPRAAQRRLRGHARDYGRGDSRAGHKREYAGVLREHAADLCGRFRRGCGRHLLCRPKQRGAHFRRL